MQKLLALIVAVLAAPTVLANHTTDRCTRGDGPAIGTVEIGLTPEHTYYLDDRYGQGVAVYRESNGIPGLQRSGGASPYIPDDTEICLDEDVVEPDERIL